MEIRDYRPGDEEQILNLFQQSFKKPLSHEFWKWRYLKNPFYSSPQIKLMWHDELLVGHYAVSPVELVINGENILSALSMTTMTHPAFAGQGIFKTLAESLYDDISKTNEIKIIWGFPNRNSHSGFIKNLKWFDLGIISTNKLRSPFLDQVPPNEYLIINSFTKTQVRKIQDNIHQGIHVNKNASFLSWRYSDNPANSYFIIEDQSNNDHDFLVIKLFDSFEIKGMKEIDILEHGFDNSQSKFLKLVGCIRQFAQDNDVNLYSINTWLPLNDSRHIILEKTGFTVDCPLTFIGYKPLASEKIDLSNLSHWYITMGDSDIY